VYTYTHITKVMSPDIHTHMYTYIYICIHTYTYVYIHTHMYTYIYITKILPPSHIHTHMHAYIYIKTMHTQVFESVTQMPTVSTHVQTYTHTHT
jgi:hypothetical protein